MRRRVRYLFRKCRGRGEEPAPVVLDQTLPAIVGGTLAIVLLVWLGQLSGEPLLIAPFGATTVLLFGVPESPLAQPRNVIGGHLLATALALLILSVLGPSLWAMCLTVGLALGLMHLTRTTHPPAGADPILVFLSPPTWRFLVSPVLAGAVALVLLALLFNNLHRSRRYPRWW